MAPWWWAGQTYRTLTFRRQKNCLDLTYSPEACTDFTDWQPMEELPLSVINNGDGTETVTYRDVEPISAPRPLLRLRVELTP